MMDVVLGALLGIGTAATIAAAAWRFVRPDGRVNEPAAGGMQAALHAASATLPHLRGGLTPRTAAKAVPYLRALTGCAAVARADTEAVLAIDGKGREQVRPGDLMHRLLAQTGDDRLHVIPRLVSRHPGCPLRAAVLAPLFVQGRRAGTLIAFYGSSRQIRRHEVRVV